MFINWAWVFLKSFLPLYLIIGFQTSSISTREMGDEFCKEYVFKPLPIPQGKWELRLYKLYDFKLL